MEKVTLTKDQAHEFESFKALRSSLEEWARDKYNPNAPHSIIHELSFDKVARAFLIGYEVELELTDFRPGDKVIRLDGLCFAGFKNIEIVERVKENSITLSNDLQYSHDFMRHATPEEIYWLEELGRKEIGDFQEGDRYVDRAGLTMTATCRNDIADFKKYYEKGDFKGLYPVESFKPFPLEVSTE